MKDTETFIIKVACVAWRFCRAGHTSGVAAKLARENERRNREKNKNQVAPAPISSRFLCPRPPLLLSAPNQNRHATQAIIKRTPKKYLKWLFLLLPNCIKQTIIIKFHHPTRQTPEMQKIASNCHPQIFRFLHYKT